jgi:hypothetical protein
MKVNSRRLLLAATVLTILNYQSCSKYEDGPAFSLKSKKGRLLGEWELVDVRGASGGFETENLEVTFEFERDGDLTVETTYSYPGYSYSYKYRGDWEFEDSKTTLELDIDGSKSEFEILRLSNQELWIEDDWRDEYRFEKQ